MITKPISAGYTSSTEDNDCTVRALANAKLGYTAAKELLAKYGRKDRCGVSLEPAAMAYAEAGFKAVWINTSSRNGAAAYREALDMQKDISKAHAAGFNRITEKSLTLGRFLARIQKSPALQQKTYICMIRGHMLCIKNGAIVDTFTSSPQCRLEVLWELV